MFSAGVEFALKQIYDLSNWLESYNTFPKRVHAIEEQSKQIKKKINKNPLFEKLTEMCDNLPTQVSEFDKNYFVEKSNHDPESATSSPALLEADKEVTTIYKNLKYKVKEHLDKAANGSYDFKKMVKDIEYQFKKTEPEIWKLESCSCEPLHGAIDAILKTIKELRENQQTEEFKVLWKLLKDFEMNAKQCSKQSVDQTLYYMKQIDKWCKRIKTLSKMYKPKGFKHLIVGEMKDRHFLSALCYQNFASLYYIPYIHLVFRMYGILALDAKKDILHELELSCKERFLLDEKCRNTKPTAEAILKAWCHPENLTANNLIYNYLWKQIVTFIPATVWCGLAIYFAVVIAKGFVYSVFLCVLPNLCVACSLLREFQLITVAVAVAVVQSIIVIMSLLKVICFKKQTNTNDCGIFELLQDLSMQALSELSGDSLTKLGPTNYDNRADMSKRNIIYIQEVSSGGKLELLGINDVEAARKFVAEHQQPSRFCEKNGSTSSDSDSS